MVACQVTRAVKFLTVFSFDPGRSRSGSYVQTFGLPAFLLKNTGVKFHAREYRAATLNQILSRMRGPPKPGLMSRTCLRESGVRRPRSFRACVRLAPAIESLAKARKEVPLKVL